MKYAIEHLERTEEVLKDMLVGYSGLEEETVILLRNLEEIQTAILILNASQELVNIGKVQGLKNQ